METETHLWFWILTLAGFLAGLLAGIALARLSGGHARKLRSISAELEEVKAAYADYRDEVNEHFRKSAELFESMTREYRAVYEHLSRGAHTLGDTRWQTPLPDSADRIAAEPSGEEPGAPPLESTRADILAAGEDEEIHGDAPVVPESEPETPDREKRELH